VQCLITVLARHVADLAGVQRSCKNAGGGAGVWVMKRCSRVCMYAEVVRACMHDEVGGLDGVVGGAQAP